MAVGCLPPKFCFASPEPLSPLCQSSSVAEGFINFIAMTSEAICIFTSLLDVTDSTQHASLQVVIVNWSLQDFLSFFSRNSLAISYKYMYVCIYI